MQIKLNKITLIVIISILIMSFMGCKAKVIEKVETFKNPIVNKTSADPFVIKAGGYYYYTYSDGSNIGIRKSKELQNIGVGEEEIVWISDTSTKYSKEVWAPELHFACGKWYIYFAADDGKNENHRMYALEAGTDPENPLGEKFKFKGKVFDKSDKWAIDGTVLQVDKDSLYFVWSGWEGDTNGNQNLYIAPMSNPFTISGERVLMSAPTYDWEKLGMPINEGPQVLVKDKNIMIVYSASGSWTENYCLGLLVNSTKDILNPKSWIKNPEPVFKGTVESKSFGVGHGSFVKSPSGKEDWIVYHGMSDGIGWQYRDVRVQKFSWDKKNLPVFGNPVSLGEALQVP